MAQTLKYLLVFFLGAFSVLLVLLIWRNFNQAKRYSFSIHRGRYIHQKLSSKNIAQEDLIFFKGVCTKFEPNIMFAIDYNPSYKANKICMLSIPDGWIKMNQGGGHASSGRHNTLMKSELIQKYPGMFSSSPDIFGGFPAMPTKTDLETQELKKDK